MERFRVRLEACDPERGRFRAYRIAAGTDLFGVWTVETTFGRTGTAGRTIREAVPDEAAARKLVRQHLRRRGTAPKRIGVAYQLRELDGPEDWMPEIAPPGTV